MITAKELQQIFKPGTQIKTQTSEHKKSKQFHFLDALKADNDPADAAAASDPLISTKKRV